MTYKYFTQFKQTQIDREQETTWDSPLNQFEFADPIEETETQQAPKSSGSISKIDTNSKAFLTISYSTEPFVKAENAQEISQKIAAYGKDPAIESFIKDMDKALAAQGKSFSSLPSAEEMQKQLSSTQIQKILLQYSKDPAFRQAIQRVMQDPAFMTGFINYINQPEQKESSK